MHLLTPSAELREVYDKYGETTLKNGYLGPDGIQSYQFSGDHEMFEIFFGTNNPFAVALDKDGKQVKLIDKIESDIHRDAVTERSDTHTEDLTVICECTLEEFYHGSQKVLEFTRHSIMGDGLTGTVDHQASKLIEVKPGMGDGTVLRFIGEGDKKAGKHAGDLVVTLRQKEHPKFIRQGNDLIYRHEISLGDALTSEGLELTTIDGETLKFRSEAIINPKTTKVFRGKGMPVYSTDPLSHYMTGAARGNLVLKFAIKFPPLSAEQKQRLIAALSE